MKQILILFLIFPVFFSSCIQEKDDPEEVMNYIRVNDKLPDFTIKDAAGNVLSSGELSGHVVLLVFFITTCPDCTRELPKIEAVWKSLKDNPGFSLVTISREESAATVSGFWEKQEFSMPFHLDPDREVFSLFANKTVPRVYLVNTKGIVTWIGIENMEFTAEQLLEKTRELLGK